MAKKLLDQLGEVLRLKHYSYRTEEAYVNWARCFILFHNKRHPAEMGAPEIRAFLAHLAQERNVSASTQNQALSAILFLYRQVLHQEIEPVLLSRAKRPERLPTVLSREEVLRLINHLSGVHKLVAQLLYGWGLRLMECVRLRVKDIDFEYQSITVRDGKGEKDRITPLPETVIPDLKRQIERLRLLHEEDLAAGCGEVYLPYALAAKYPNAAGVFWSMQAIYNCLGLIRNDGGHVAVHLPAVAEVLNWLQFDKFVPDTLENQGAFLFGYSTFLATHSLKLWVNDLRSQVGFKRGEVAIVVEQLMRLFDAERGDRAVDGFADGDSLFAQGAIVAGALHGKRRVFPPVCHSEPP